MTEDGWHWREWGAELAGTALLLFAVVTAKDWAVAAGPPFSHLESRIVIVGTVAGLAVLALALSPLGRRSGAHLNPAVTIGFWAQGVVGRADALGYTLAQMAGAVLGVAAARVWGAGVGTGEVGWAVIAPDPGLAPATATVIEAGATFAQLVVVYAVLLHPRLQRLVAPLAGGLLTVAIIGLATVTGAGFNPTRGFGPDVLARTYPAIGVYVVGPVAGALAAAAVLVLWGRRPVTGKLRHNPSVPCHMYCALPHTQSSD